MSETQTSPTQPVQLPTAPAPKPTTPPVEGEELVSLTPLALEKAKAFIAEESDPSDKVLRVGVDSGGCSGFSYKVEVDVEKPGDHVQRYDGLSVVCDPVGLQFLKGARLDYVDEIGEAGFRFDNPQASSTCGCGISFNV